VNSYIYEFHNVTQYCKYFLGTNKNISKPHDRQKANMSLIHELGDYWYPDDFWANYLTCFWFKYFVRRLNDDKQLSRILINLYMLKICWTIISQHRRTQDWISRFGLLSIVYCLYIYIYIYIYIIYILSLVLQRRNCICCMYSWSQKSCNTFFCFGMQFTHRVIGSYSWIHK